MSVASLFTPCFVMFCVFLYGPFCHGAHKLDLSTLFTSFFLWTSPPFILVHWTYYMYMNIIMEHRKVSKTNNETVILLNKIPNRSWTGTHILSNFYNMWIVLVWKQNQKPWFMKRWYVFLMLPRFQHWLGYITSPCPPSSVLWFCFISISSIHIETTYLYTPQLTVCFLTWVSISG